VESGVQDAASGSNLIQHIHRLPWITRSQPAFRLRRQPELCQQAAEEMISPLRMAVQSLPIHAAWFRGSCRGCRLRGWNCPDKCL
jgi:hypothetical protein